MDSPRPINFDSNVDKASHYMKVLANKHRLIVMCKIKSKPYTVSELVSMTGMSQPALSMHLAKLRDEGMVSAERAGKEVFYSIANDHLKGLVEHVCCRFQC